MQFPPFSRRRMRMREKLERVVRKRPLLAGAAAVGLGAAVSMMFPTTEREAELLHDAREAMRDRGRDVSRGPHYTPA